MNTCFYLSNKLDGQWNWTNEAPWRIWAHSSQYGKYECSFDGLKWEREVQNDGIGWHGFCSILYANSLYTFFDMASPLSSRKANSEIFWISNRSLGNALVEPINRFVVRNRVVISSFASTCFSNLNNASTWLDVDILYHQFINSLVL